MDTNMNVNMGTMMGGVCMLTWLLFLVALVVGIVFLIRALTDRGSSAKSSAIGVLEERFARGEIDATELAERRRELTRS